MKNENNSIGCVEIEKSLLVPIVDVLSCIKKDSSPEVGSVYFRISDHKLDIIRGNRYSKVVARFPWDIGCPDLTTQIPFDDLSKIVKLMDETLIISFQNNKSISIDGIRYTYKIQDINFKFSEVVDREIQGNKSFTLSNSFVKQYCDLLFVAPMNRVPPVLDSVWIHKNFIYSAHPSIVSRVSFLDCDESLKPIPPLVFQVSNKLSEDCDVDFLFGNNYVMSQFSVGNSVSVSCMCSYFDGIYPKDQILEMWKEVGVEMNASISVEKSEIIPALMRIKAISKTSLNIVDVEVEGLSLKVFKAYSEKSVSASINIDKEYHASIGGEKNIHHFNGCRFAVDSVIRAIKKMEDKIFIDKYDKYLIFRDNYVTHLVPVMH